MSWKNYDTDEIINDKEMEDVCTECRCFCSEGTLSLECDGIKENCPYYKHIKKSFSNEKMDMNYWNDVKKVFPKEIKVKGHGLCNLLVVYPYGGVPRVEQVIFIGGKFKTFRDRDITNIVTHWMYLPELP